MNHFLENHKVLLGFMYGMGLCWGYTLLRKINFPENFQCRLQITEFIEIHHAVSDINHAPRTPPPHYTFDFINFVERTKGQAKLFGIVDGDAEQRNGYFQSSTPFLRPCETHREKCKLR
jgi:hypothetical protein